MTDFEKKEEKAIDKISTVLTDLDETLAKIDQEMKNGREKSIKCWFEEKKAIHEIKKILHEIDKYNDYNEKELDNLVDEWD